VLKVALGEAGYRAPRNWRRGRRNRSASYGDGAWWN